MKEKPKRRRKKKEEKVQFEASKVFTKAKEDIDETLDMESARYKAKKGEAGNRGGGGGGGPSAPPRGFPSLSAVRNYLARMAGMKTEDDE